MYKDIEDKHGITLKQANALFRDLICRHGGGHSILSAWGCAIERANKLEDENKCLHRVAELARDAVESGAIGELYLSLLRDELAALPNA